MSYDSKNDEITVNGLTYDVIEGSPDNMGDMPLTLELDGEEIFAGLRGELGCEHYDAELFNPREWSNVGTMAVSYRGYNLGDEDISKIDFEVQCPVCEGSNEDPNGNWVVGIHATAERLAVGSEDECKGFLYALEEVETGRYYIEPFGCPNEECEEGYITLNPVDYFKRERGARVVIGLTVYEHSGIMMQAGNVTLPWDTDRWDTSFVGFIFDTPEGVKQCLGDDATDEQIEQALRQEVATYSSYLEGDVTNWMVEDDETGFYEAVGGYVGDHDYCKSECFAALERAIEKRLAEIEERAEMAARDIPTV